MPQNLWCTKSKSLYIYIWPDPGDDSSVFLKTLISQQDLIAWLDTQEQKYFLRVAPIDETVEAFDPLYNDPEVAPALRPLPQRIVELYKVEELGEQGRGGEIRRTKKWRFDKIFTHSLASRMLHKIRSSVRRRHKINYRVADELRNIETNECMVWYQNINSPWFSRLSETQAWLQDQEDLRLQGENIGRPNTKWVFQRHVFVDLKVTLDRQPLQIGRGRLPDWLRSKHEVISLDTYNDNLCLFRCIAVHRGAHKRDNTRRARELAQSVFAAYPKLTAVTSQQFELVEKHFKQGIAAYSVKNAGDFILIHQPSRYDKVSHPTMHMGIYENHAFLIKDINKVSNNFTCDECLARFTRADNLKRHASWCTLGQTEISCPGNQILAPESAFEKAFYPEGTFGTKGICWLERLSRKSGKHIHHHKCGHGGERFIKGVPVDGYHPETKTVFQFHGCHWHGCIQCFPNPEQRTEVIRIDKNGKETTREIAYLKTLARSDEIRNLGYNLVERWEHEEPSPWLGDKLPRKRNETYPHAIVFDFESYQDKTKASNPTRELSYESEHVPISVSIADTINTEPEYICSKDHEELIRLFY